MLPLLLDSGSNRIIHEVSDLTHNSCKVRKTVDLMADICRTHLSGSKTQHQSEYSCREEVNNSGWEAPALQAVLRAFLEDALIAAVNTGGDADTIGAVCGQIAGACMGFLWHNCEPARLIMGDTGSLALGGALSLIAIMLGQQILLFIIGGVFIIELA